MNKQVVANIKARQNSKGASLVAHIVFAVAFTLVNLCVIAPVISQCLSVKPAGLGTNNDCTNANPWNNFTNIYASDNDRSVTTSYSSNLTDCLHASGFGFNIPASATITGVEVSIERRFVNVDNLSDWEVRDNVIQLLNASGVTFGNNLANTTTDWPTVEAVATYGSSSSLWGLPTATLTPAVVNDADFGVRLQARRVNGANSGTTRAQVDYIEIRVYYTDVVAITAASPVCASSTGNTASVSVTGATAWSWTVTGGTLTGGSGTNSITYTAGTGSSLTINVSVTTPEGTCTTGTKVVTVNALPTFSVSKTDITCFNAGNGTITITASGGTLPYDYKIKKDAEAWSSWIDFTDDENDNVEVLGSKGPGNYTIQIRDNYGCEQINCTLIP